MALDRKQGVAGASIAAIEPLRIRSGANLHVGVRDISRGFLAWRVWFNMALEDLQRRYHRAILGLLWVSISFFAFVAVKAVVFDRFADDPAFSFTIYLAIGFLIWQYINGIVSDGADVFASSANWIKGLPLPLSLFIYQSIVRNIVTAAYSSIVVVAAFAWEGVAPTWGALWAVPAILFLIFSSLWVELLVGVVATRFRDIKHLIQTVMRVMFFLTPIIWVPGVMGRLGEYVYWLPFANYIEIVRQPLMEGRIDAFHWIYVLALTGAGYLIAVPVFALNRHRIVYWI